jgi:hypothetical protein
LSSPHTEPEAPKDNEASPVKVMGPPLSRTTNPPPEQDGHPPSSPYDTIHHDLAIYKTMIYSDPTNQFFEAMKNLKSSSGSSSAMSAPAPHAQTYMRTYKIESYEEDGEVYN